MKSRIARRLALYFAAALLLFTVVLGALFIALFRAETLNSEREALQARAVSIAGRHWQVTACPVPPLKTAAAQGAATAAWAAVTWGAPVPICALLTILR